LVKTCETLDYYSDYYNKVRVMGCDALKFGWNSPSFPRNVYPVEGSNTLFLSAKEFQQSPEITPLKIVLLMKY